MCVHRGKFGQVFKLVEKATKKVWAGKFIKAYSVKEKDNVRQEIGIMNSLHHPKLVQCIDAFEGKSDIVMVLEMYVTLTLTQLNNKISSSNFFWLTFLFKYICVFML